LCQPLPKRGIKKILSGNYSDLGVDVDGGFCSFFFLVSSTFISFVAPRNYVKTTSTEHGKKSDFSGLK
jgi:hypothetical protein